MNIIKQWQNPYAILQIREEDNGRLNIAIKELIPKGPERHWDALAWRLHEEPILSPTIKPENYRWHWNIRVHEMAHMITVVGNMEEVTPTEDVCDGIWGICTTENWDAIKDKEVSV